MSIKNILLGKALSNEQLKREKMSRLWGLPIMSSDAISSVAYAVEEILLALVPAMGMMAVGYVGFVGAAIIFLLLLLIFSYTQIINHYPNGGGSYTVSKEHFGKNTSLVAATCLIVDYIMTCAVSVSSSTAAIVAAIPQTANYKVIISVVCLGIVTLVNLRGVRESSKIFGLPTYAFIVSMIAMIVFGFIRFFMGSLHSVGYTAEQQALIHASTLQGITLLLFLKAFSGGCTALTGVEAVSNAVPNFKDPPCRTAKHVLFLLGAIIVFVFGGTCFLATVLKVVPMTNLTVISQMANAVFGNTFMFYAVQFTTSLILLLAANTAYNGLPMLLSILARDRYMPRQFAQRGTKLSFSNGIMFIFIIAALLIIAFNSDTHKLIPFYAVGVFVSFTFSQAGMFMKWYKEKPNGWQYKSLINAIGTVITFVGTFVIFISKFIHGAWALIIVIPLIMFFMSATHKHYEKFQKANSIEDGFVYRNKKCSSDRLPCIVLVHNMSKAALKTLDYARDVTSDITALHISTTPAHTEALEAIWEKLGIDIPLTVISTPYRDMFTPLEEYISEREKSLKEGEILTVMLTKCVGHSWRDEIFHNQTAFFIESKIGHHKNTVSVLVPYQYDI